MLAPAATVSMLALCCSLHKACLIIKACNMHACGIACMWQWWVNAHLYMLQQGCMLHAPVGYCGKLE